MSKKELTERDICTKYITPAIKQAGWDIDVQVREEKFFTAGRIYVKGKMHVRGKKKRADYILYYKPNIPIAIIEAKDNNHSVKSGIQQALDYAKTLDIPFVYSTNGDAFFEHDKSLANGVIEREIALEEFPSPEELWRRYKILKGIAHEDVEKIVSQDYYDTVGKEPRYYQAVAINRTIESIAKGNDRALLVMATGTGKTYTAFQIAWRLWKAGKKKRILFLADRNALIGQAKRNDFKYFGDKMTVVRHHKVDKSFEVYLALYQGLTGNEEDRNIYKQFSPDFFDLVIVDECHRGSAADDAAWREILEYFTNASQIGLTATPKETKEISNIDYFKEPVYTYSLKQGIEDGFLAPYKVVRIGLDKDLEGYRPEKGKTDKEGNLVEDRLYNTRDFDRTLVIEERTKLVAKKVSEYLKLTNRFDKTIIFCVDIDHADRMRACLVNENKDLVQENHKYIMKITGDDEEGKRELDNFIDPEQKYPVIATTSKLMTTGVDAQTCKLIVLDANIQSMTEFKQIIGRGTRINEEFGKYYFTIMDFRNATNLFADKDFDGEPVKIYEPKAGDILEVVAADEEGDFIEIDGERVKVKVAGQEQVIETGENGRPSRKVFVSGVEVKVLNERVQYYGVDGKLISESLKDYSKKHLQQEFRSLDEFINKWNSVQKKQELHAELLEHGIFIDELQEAVNKDLDTFDLICHVAFDKPPLTRKERANNVKKRNYFTKYGEQAKNVLEALLDKYADKGIENIESAKVLELEPLSQMGTPAEIVKWFGGPSYFRKALKELENELYKSA
ncbi:MAG TPA: DEAD/DEAH box helicase family protein [Bacteroidia bacterium]|jgi:type I restriction enzyme R subunit|nr:DEAD/DEAH box helicase family protein [Bacteroidia bacterium]